MRRRQALAGVLIAAAVSASGCGAPPAPVDTGAGETREVAHARGTAQIVGTPQRVVVLDTGELDSVLALGVTPVGAVSAFADGELLGYLADRTGEVEIVGTIAQPNLEAIAALQPDLILSSEIRHPEIFDELSQIAPTVFAAAVGVAWKDNLRLAGEALGRSEQAEQLLADHQAKAERTGQAFGDPAGTSVSMVRFVGETVRLYGEASFIGTVLADAGFARPPVQQVQETFVEVSAEEIGQAEGDVLFYASFGDAGVADQMTVTAGPLWQELAVVQAGQANAVPDDLWYLGIGPIAAGLVLDDLATFAP